MLGISLTKVATVVLVILAVLVALRLLGRITQRRSQAQLPEETRPCPACGSYVAHTLATPCGRADCPYLAQKPD
ncbi:MAG: hypothetical protein EXQ85_01130 [Alphaproteobacteria bacterium]|nr:hypothetical protein [Alphaproteobacteria bacterium]